MPTPRIGSISSGTLRPQDLMETFLEELQMRDKEAAESEVLFFVEELTNALSDLAPPYTYFGSHPGDGADFGFWPDMEAINDLSRVQNSDEAIALGEDCCFVNDHGNVTIYSSTGEIILEIV